MDRIQVFFRVACLIFLISLILPVSSAQNYLSDEFSSGYPYVSMVDGSNIMYLNSQDSNNDYESAKKQDYQTAGVIADFNNDGDLEIANVDGNNDLILHNISNKLPEVGSFGVDGKAAGSSAPMTVGEFDGDDYPDILFANSNDNSISIIDWNDGSETDLRTFSNVPNVVDIADVDKNGEKDVVWARSSQYVEYCSISELKEENCDPNQLMSYDNLRMKSLSTLADIDQDGLLEISLIGNDGDLYHSDIEDGAEVSHYDSGSPKQYPFSYLWNDENKDEKAVELAVSSGNTRLKLCRLGSCSRKDPGTRGISSSIPPFVKEPELNSDKVAQRDTVSVQFNVTDWEGYTDILNSEAVANFTSPSGNSYIINADESTDKSAVSGSSINENYVPDDGKTKAFNASFSIPDDAETGKWNVTVQVKDEKMTGTKNWTTFKVEKALVEKNVSESLSVGRKDTSRQTSLGKSQITGLIMDSQKDFKAFTFRGLSESLGFSSDKGRSQYLGKALATGMAFSSSGASFKTAFSTLGSEIIASSEVSDIYSALRSFDPVFGFSDSASDKAFFGESIYQSYGVDEVVSGQSLFMRTDPLSLTVDFGNNRSSDVSRSVTVGLEAGSSPLTGLAFGRSFDPVLSFSGVDTDRSDALFSRSSEQGLAFSETLTRNLGSTYFKTLTTPFGFSSSPVRSGVDLSVSLASALDLGTDGSRDSIYARSVESIISPSIDSFVGQDLFRDFVTDYIADSGELRAQNVSRATDNSITGSFTSSRSSSLDRLLSGSIAQTFGFSRSDAFFERSSSQSISISEVFESERTFGRAMSFSYSFVSSPVESTAGYFRALSSDIFLDTVGDSSVLFERQESTGIRSNSTLSRGISVSRYLSTTLTPGLTVEAFDGVMIALDQTLGFESTSSDLLESSRSQDTSLEASSDYSSSISFFRTFSQSVGFDLGLGDLIDFVLEFFREDPGGGGNGDGGGTDGGSTSSPGGGTVDVPVSDGNDSVEDDSTSNSTGEEDGDDEDVVKIIEASLKESEVSNNEVTELTENITGVDRGQKVVLDISHKSEREVSSNESEANTTLEQRDLIHVNTVEFEAQRSEEDPDISLTTFDEVGEAILNIEDKNVYEATEVSTNFDTGDASLVYEVEKKFLSTNNATTDEIVVSRWKNQSKVGDLNTKVMNESEDAYSIKAISPEGFSVLVVSLKNSDNQIDDKPDSGSIISLPNVSPGTISLLLLISTVLLLRREILINTFTSDLKVKKARLKASMFVLKLRKRLDVRKEREAGKKEYSLAEEVESLENKVEVMKYKKKKQSEEIENMEDIYNRLRYECTLLAERIREGT